MSLSSTNDLDSQLNEAFKETFEHHFEDTFNAFMEVQATKPKKREFIERNREEGHNRLWSDYFSEDPTYPPRIFRRRFRMNKSLFTRIVDRVSNEVPYFQQRRDGGGRLGLSGLQKCTTSVRILAYGCAADGCDEYLRLGVTTALLCLDKFTDAIIELFGQEYLRRPTPEDLQRLLDIGEIRGFPGMIGRIDCMHWEWKNCPTAWRGQYTRGSRKPTIVLEDVASQDLWIWHAFFGPPGTLNDINVLDRSPVFDDILQGRHQKWNTGSTGTSIIWRTTSQTEFTHNGQHLSNLYHCLKVLKQSYLLNIKNPSEKMSNVLLEYCKLGFAIVKNPALIWDKAKIGKIMRTCIILHNMIVEDERDGYTQYDTSDFEQGESSRSSEVDLRILQTCQQTSVI